MCMCTCVWHLLSVRMCMVHVTKCCSCSHRRLWRLTSSKLSVVSGDQPHFHNIWGCAVKYVPLEIPCASTATPPHTRPHLTSLPHLPTPHSSPTPVCTHTHVHIHILLNHFHIHVWNLYSLSALTPHTSPSHPHTLNPLCTGLPETAAESAMVIEPSQPAEMADVDSEVDSEVVRQHAVWSGYNYVFLK